MANEVRRRTNNVQGQLSASITSTSTTMTSAGLVNLEAISSTEHAAINIDPGRSAGAPEIVYVTAHSAASTSANILRAQEGTAARSHSTGVTWLHAPTAAVDFLPYRPPSVRVESAAATTVASGSTVAVIFGTEVFDTDSMWSSTAATRININTAGKYLVGGQVRFSESTGGSFRTCRIRKNGTESLTGDLYPPPETGHLQARFTVGPTMVDLTSTEYVELAAEHNAGVSLTIANTTASKLSQFWATWQSS